MNCEKCGGGNVTVQVRTEEKTKRRGCFAWGLWVLAAICTLGIVLIIPIMTNKRTKSKTFTEALCQDCGHRWKVKDK